MMYVGNVGLLGVICFCKRNTKKLVKVKLCKADCVALLYLNQEFINTLYKEIKITLYKEIKIYIYF